MQALRAVEAAQTQARPQLPENNKVAGFIICIKKEAQKKKHITLKNQYSWGQRNEHILVY